MQRSSLALSVALTATILLLAACDRSETPGESPQGSPEAVGEAETFPSGPNHSTGRGRQRRVSRRSRHGRRALPRNVFRRTRFRQQHRSRDPRCVSRERRYRVLDGSAPAPEGRRQGAPDLSARHRVRRGWSPPDDSAEFDTSVRRGATRSSLVRSEIENGTVFGRRIIDELPEIACDFLARSEGTAFVEIDEHFDFGEIVRARIANLRLHRCLNDPRCNTEDFARRCA